MITETIIYDHQIREVSRKTKEISFDHVIYEDNDGLHKINLDVCSENFNEEYGKSSGTCVGVRNIEKSWFILYTSGVKTKIIFKRSFVFGFSARVLLYGTKTSRFLQFKQKLLDANYTTLDMT